jgi:hypothetical protein
MCVVALVTPSREVEVKKLLSNPLPLERAREKASSRWTLELWKALGD